MTMTVQAQLGATLVQTVVESKPERQRNERFDEILRVLGSPKHRATQHSLATPFIHRSSWECGCTLDVIDDSARAYQWHSCLEHNAIAGASFVHRGLDVHRGVDVHRGLDA